MISVNYWIMIQNNFVQLCENLWALNSLKYFPSTAQRITNRLQIVSKSLTIKELLIAGVLNEPFNQLDDYLISGKRIFA